MLRSSPKNGWELQLIGTRQLRDHVPRGLEFDFVQLAGQPASGEKEAWNADALMEGVRAGTGRGDFLAALEDRVMAEESQWAPLLLDARGYADLAARRRELLTHRLEARRCFSALPPGTGTAFARWKVLLQTERRPTEGSRWQP